MKKRNAEDMKGRKRITQRICAIVMILMVFFSMPAISFAAGYLGAWDTKNNTRLAGADRYKTSEKVMDYMISKYIKNPTCFVVASGANYPDALSGAYLANYKDAPLILTTKGGKDKEVLNKIKSKVKDPSQVEVILLGGEAAVSAEFEGMAKDAGFNVKRLGGAHRYATNTEILKEVGEYFDRYYFDGILVCSGTKYADALSGSGVPMPIMLVNNDTKQLTTAQKSILSKLKGHNIYILGGTAAVDESIEKALKKYGNVVRIAGANRYETSYEIAKYFLNHGYFNFKRSCIFAYGKNFPDGLVAGPLAMKEGIPILLMDSKNYLDAREYAEYIYPSTTITIGGTGILPDSTIKKVMAEQSAENLSAWQQKAYNSASSMRKKVLSAAYSHAAKNTRQNCHQLVVNSYKAAGIQIVDAYDGKYYDTKGNYKTAEKTNNPVPGDIIVYNNHVAIYIGKDASGEAMAVHGGWYGDGVPNETVIWRQWLSTGKFLHYWHIPG